MASGKHVVHQVLIHCRRYSGAHALCVARGALSITLLLLQLTVAGTASAEGSVARSFGGQVLDADTGLPLPGVHVIALYKHNNDIIGHSEQVCTQIEYMITGADGQYAFPTDRYGNPEVQSFRTGYTGVRSPRYVQDRRVTVAGQLEVRYFAVETDVKTKQVVREESYATREEAERAARINDHYLKPFSGGRSERADQLWRDVTRTLCSQAKGDRRKIVPYLNAIYIEMKEVAVTKQDLERLETIKDLMERARRAS